MTHFGPKVFGATALLLASTAIAHAGGVERNPQTTSILFEEGTYGTRLHYRLAGCIGHAGDPPAPRRRRLASGDVAPAYSFSSLAFRTT
jgi:hypothetical protein